MLYRENNFAKGHTMINLPPLHPKSVTLMLLDVLLCWLSWVVQQVFRLLQLVVDILLVRKVLKLGKFIVVN